MPWPHRERLRLRDAEIAVYQAGSGRDVIAVHGFQNDHSAWDPFVQRLDLEQTRVTALDLVGCGSSSAASAWTRCTIDEYARDLIAVCEALRLDAPIAIGHSLGGAIVLDAALAAPTRFTAAVLVAPASTSGLDFLPDEHAFGALAHPPADQQRALATAAFRHPPGDDELSALLAVIARATPEHIEGAARSMRDFTRQDDLSMVAVRTLLVCGDRDRHVPLANHLATQQRIPRCGLQVYFDVGHVPFVEVPDRFAADVARFMALVPAYDRHDDRRRTAG
jgi:sigma-B regulation protein RsbQ